MRVHHSSNEAARSGVGSSLDLRRRRGPRRRAGGAARPASSSANGPGMPGGGTGAPICALTASITTPSHGLRSRGPQTASATRPPGRSTRRISRAARARVERRTSAPRGTGRRRRSRRARRCRSRSRSRARHVAQAQRRGARRGDRRHLGRRRRRATTSPPGADELGRREPDAARAAGQLEHALAGARAAPAPSICPVDRRAARVDVVGVLAPRRRPRRPTCRASRARAHPAVRCSTHRLASIATSRDIHYSLQ